MECAFLLDVRVEPCEVATQLLIEIRFSERSFTLISFRDRWQEKTGNLFFYTIILVNKKSLN